MENDLKFGRRHGSDLSYTFNYVYTCYFDALFLSKIGSLDGILPTTSNLNENSSKYTTVQNHYDYNVVEDLCNFSLSDDIQESSDDEVYNLITNNEDNQEETTSGIESDEKPTRKSSFVHPSLSTPKSGDKKQRKQKKKKKLAEIIFGSLNQPFRALSCHPYITCDLISNGRRLCPPQQTQYKQMNVRYEWNEWLLFSLSLDSLPRDTVVCFTVWDTLGPGKMAAVARTSISLFSKRGCLRKGLYDLRLFFDEDYEEYLNDINNNKSSSKIFNSLSHGSSGSDSDMITIADINFNDREHQNEEFVLPEKEMLAKFQKQTDFHSMASKENRTLPYLQKSNQIDKNNENLISIDFQSTTQYLKHNLSTYPLGTCSRSKKIRQLNKAKKKYQNDQLPKLDWLDKLTYMQIEHAMVEDRMLSTFVFLTVEFPTIHLDGIEHVAVYYEDKEEQCCFYDMIEKDIVTIFDPEKNFPNLVEDKHHALVRSARSGISSRDHKPNALTRNQLNAIVNYPSTHQLSNEEQDLIWKFRFYLCNQKKALAKFLKTVNWNSFSEAEQAIDLMNEWTPMDIEDALELLSPHFTHPAVRKYAVNRLKEASDEDLLLYLLQLVQALKYENFVDIYQAFKAELAEYREQTANVSFSLNKESKSDKLFLDSPHSMTEAFLADSSKVTSEASTAARSQNSLRQISVEKAMPATDIVAAIPTNTQTNNKSGQDLATFLLNRACLNDELANYFYWYLIVECEGSKSIGSSGTSSNNEKQSHASSGGLSANTSPFNDSSSNATNKQKLKSNFEQISSSSNNVIEMFQIMSKRFKLLLLRGTPEMKARQEFLLRQQEFVVRLVEIMKEVARENGNRLKKIEKLRSILSSFEHQFRSNFNKDNPLPFPLNPKVKIVGVVSEEATLFKSAMMPAKLAFLTDQGSIIYTIFKNGDDLRQDDLVLQMINLMDKLLRKENLDLKLTPYRVLACSSKYGFVQFIDSQSVAEVNSTFTNINNYLSVISNQQHLFINQQSQTITSSSSISDFQYISTGLSSSSRNNVPSNSGIQTNTSNTTCPDGILPDIMEAYIKSFAGYCVITYLLGVGDRHLDNLMLTKTGRLFHIDFGFILGRDPKVRPPPMKITRDMIEAMGGINSENFSKFCTLVRTAFLHLRRHANLILNLFSLMVDANVPDIALEPDKTVQKIQDKFKLELSDEQADHYITEQVEQSVRSILPVVVDQLHKVTQRKIKFH